MASGETAMSATRAQGTNQRNRRAWIAYLVVGIITLALFLFVHPIRVGPLFNLIAWSGAAAALIALVLHRPAQRLPWILIAIGQMLFMVGDILTYNYQGLFGTELPFPSIGDPFYLSVYPFVIGGILLLIRRRSPGGDRASLIDSLIIAVGVGAISWVFLISPYVRDETLSLGQKLVAMAYPIMDLALFSVAVRLAVGAGKRPLAFFLITSGVVVLFATDTIYGWIVLHGGYDNSTGYLEGGWGLFYLLLGAAALHPTMRLLDAPSTEADPKHSRKRLVILAGASLVAPTIQLVQALRHASSGVDVSVVALCAISLFILVLVRLNGVMVDINDHRRTERQLREAENKYRTLVEGLPAVVYIAEFGEEGAWRYISPQIESVLGFTQDEWTSGTELWRDRILPADRQKALDAELQLLGGGRMHCEYRIAGRNGRVLWIREEAEPLLDDHGKPMYLQGVMYDITDQKQAEEQLVRALETEKEASNRLRALHEMQNSFLQAVSHDLRTPLTTILGGALTLERTDLQLSEEDARALLHGIASNARKLHRLLTNLLDLDRLSRGTIEPNRSFVDMHELTLGVLADVATETHPIKVVADGPVISRIDAAQVERIIENLVTNAVRYTPPGTPIWVRLQKVAGGSLITVEDAGPGVPPELRETIFEPFRQGSEVVRHSPGVGIGLSLVARFAELHGGRAWVEDRPGGGARFGVSLPEGAGALRSMDGASGMVFDAEESSAMSA
jgi:PAS domain S-box-containing protein